ncbi:VCBS domain-containing protein, partial [Shewanella sp. 0m-11]
NQFAATSLQGQFGALTLNNLGHWTYTADNSQAVIQGLKSGESLTDTLIVHSVDGTEQKISVTINGTDDKAIIAGTSAASVTEDKDVHGGQLRVDGALSVTDADAGQNQFAATSLQGQFGALTINNLGHWTYTADNSQAVIQGLKSGESLTDTLLVHSVDGTEQKISVTINGTDDKAQIGGVDTGSISENTAGVDMSPDHAQPGIATLGNATLYADGKLTITDPDVGESGFERQGSNGYDYHGTYGDLILLTDGTWHYHADAGHRAAMGARPTTRGTAIDQLGEGQSLTDTITVHSKDGTSHDIVITIHGSNDRPYCSSE